MRFSDDTVSWSLAAWWALFAAYVAWLGDTLTSKQWQLLMSVPGGKWTWAAVFITGSLLIAAGLILRNKPAVTAGLLLDGLGFTLIGAFYILAPLLDPGLRTAGWFPWVGFAVITFAVALSRASDG